MATAAPVGNIAGLLDPSLVGDQLSNQQQQALAQLLLQEGYTPMQNTQMAGNVALRNSPTQSMAKIAQILSGQNMQQSANQQASALAARQSAALMPLYFGQQQPQQAPPQGQQPPQGGQPMQQMPGGVNPSSPGPLTMPGMDPRSAFLASQMYPQQYGDAFVKANTPNDTSIQATQGQMDPVIANRMMFLKQSTDPKILGMRQAGMSDQDIYRAIFGEAAKASEFDRRPGNAYSNPLTGEAGIVPKIPENANIIGRPGPNGAIQGVSQIPGAPGVMAGNTAASAAGTNSQTPTVGYVNNQPVPMTKAQQVSQATQGARDSDAVRIVDMEIAQEKDPAARAALQRYRDRIAGGNITGPLPEQSPGVVTGANDAQKQLGDRFGQLRDTVSTAQTTNSYLDNIKQLSTTAATGKFSDRLDYVNALLSPFSERATDAKTANDLLNKYSNQIVSRLSTGGLGTDAARTILGSAYPNAHMTQGAIGEAVDNIKSVNGMLSAKLSFLSQAGNSRDAAGYQQREQQFDQMADPRLWQLKAMTPAQGQAYVAKLPPQVRADLMQKMQTLKQMGAL